MSSERPGLQEQLRPFAHRLESAGVGRAWREVRLLAAWAAGRSYDDVLLERFLLSEEEAQRLDEAVRLRARRKPLAKIVRQASFWKSTFKTTEATLDPRPESELFIEELLRLVPDKESPLSLLDLGTGTGCLLLSCLGEYPQARGLGVDLSGETLAVARENASELERGFPGIQRRVTFLQSDWTHAVSGIFDVVLCNPPYVEDEAYLEPEILFDPPLALFGGPDGLDVIRGLFSQMARVIHAKSWLLLEIGQGQAHAVSDIAQRQGFQLDHTVPDFQGIPRLLVFRLAESEDDPGRSPISAIGRLF